MEGDRHTPAGRCHRPSVPDAMRSATTLPILIAAMVCAVGIFPPFLTRGEYLSRREERMPVYGP